MPKIDERVFRIQAPYGGNAVHLYLIRGSKLALIDSGSKFSPKEAVEPALRELGLGWSDLDYLVNTHGHPDHAGGNGEVKAEAPRAEVALHRDDVALVEGVEAHLRARTDASALFRLLGREDLIAEREATLRQVIGNAVGVDRELSDGDTIDLGQDVRLSVVHTPGHTPGSVCLYWEGGRVLFSGDAIQGHGWRHGVTPLYFDAAYVGSLDRIEGLGAETLCMGHTFSWGGVSNDPVRRGAEIGQTLEASRHSAAAIDRAVDLALEQHGREASFATLAETAVRELAFSIPVLFDRQTYAPTTALASFRAHLEAKG
jgi:glyoxylase-like metal-dependent hydrolase (beta-lactamase superfamily II)